MKTAIVAITLALASPASAFTANPNQGWEVPESIAIVCIPEALHGTDPVVRTEVNANFTPQTQEITNLTVVHELFSGAKRNRDDQYDADSLIQAQKNKAMWGWHGYLKKNRAQEMVGLLWYAQNGVWHYGESISLHKREIFNMASTCHFYGDLESEYEDKR